MPPRRNFKTPTIWFRLALILLTLSCLSETRLDAAPAPPDPAATYARVERYLQEGAYQKAIEALARLSFNEHRTWRYHYYDGRVYLGLNQYRNAIDQFQQAAAQRPDDPLIYAYWGDVYAAMKSWDQALIQYHRATTLAPGNPRFQFKVGQAALARAQGEQVEQKRLSYLAEAETALRKAAASPALEPGPRYDAWVQLGLIHRGQRRLQEAEKAWWKALALRGLSRSQTGQAYRLIGEALLARRNWPGALNHLRRAADLNPQDQAAWVGLGLAYLAGQKISDASRAFNQALRVDSEYVHGYNGLGLVSVFSGDVREARDHFATMLRLAEKRYVPEIRELTAAAVTNRGASEELGGDLAAADRSYQNALERWSRSVPAHVDLGNLALREGSPGKALRHYQIVENQLEDDPLFVLSLGTIYLHNGHVQRAQAAFERVQQRNPKDHRLLLGTAVGHFIARQWQEAASAVERVLAADPKNELAWFLMDAVAARDWKLPVALRDKLEKHHQAAAQQALRLGQKRLAEYHWMRVLDSIPGHLAAGHALARLREEDGRLQGALAVYQSLTAAGVDGDIAEQTSALEARIRQLEEAVARPPTPAVTASPTPSPSPGPSPHPASPAPSPSPSLYTPSPTPSATPGSSPTPGPASPAPSTSTPPSPRTPDAGRRTPSPPPSPQEVTPPLRPRLALLPFHIQQWQLLGPVLTSYVADGPAVGLAALIWLRAELEAHGRLEVVDAETIDRVLQQFNVIPIGRPDGTALLQVGRASGARLTILGDLDEVGTRTWGRVRIIEADTNRTLHVLKAQTTGGDRLERMRQVAQQLARQIMEHLPLEASVVEILSPQEVLINAGQEQGVQIKDTFEVWRPSLVLGKEDKWADLRVIAVSPLRARALVVPFGRSSVQLAVGDRARTRALP